MPAILRKLPFYENQTTVRLPSGLILDIKHHQIIAWVSITHPQMLTLPPTALRFPAVLDIGFNDNFLIQERQLTLWAGIVPHDLPLVDFLRAEGARIPLRDADVWIHPNRPGLRDEFANLPAFCLELDTGIAVWPSGLPGARRLPLLGLRGLHRANLQLWIDCQSCRVSLRTPRRLWIFP